MTKLVLSTLLLFMLFLSSCVEYRGEEVPFEKSNTIITFYGDNTNKKIESPLLPHLSINADYSFDVENSYKNVKVKKFLFSPDILNKIFVTDKYIDNMEYIAFSTEIGNSIVSLLEHNNETKLFENCEENTLSTLTPDEAFAKISKITDQLGLEIYLSEIYTLNSDTLNSVQSQLLQQDNYKWIIRNNRVKNIDWSKNKEKFYYLKIYVTFDNIIVEPNSYVSNKYKNFIVNGGNITAVISDRDIEYFYLNGTSYQLSTTQETITKTISLEEALEKLKEKYEKIILTDDYIVKEASIRYVPLLGKNIVDISLYPCWYFEIEQDSDAIKKNMIIERFNAVTGQEIY